MNLDHRLHRTQAVNAAAARHGGDAALARRCEILADIHRRGILATPANSSINELVTEAARLSIANGGQRVTVPGNKR